MKKKKWIIILGLLIVVSVIVVAVGLKYFPFNKVVSIPSSSETEFTNPQKIHSSAPHSLFFDFEMTPGKDTPDGFYKGIAHSGQFSAKAFGQNSFGASIERTAGELGLENLKAVSLSAWVYVFPGSKEVSATLVFAASNELGVNICWKGVGLSGPGIPKGKWFKISGNIDLSEVKFKPDYKLKVYFWNNSPTDILVDDYYMVFGGPVERRGDSAMTDMTKGGAFNARFNSPPFPVIFLERETAFNKITGLTPSSHFLAGDFLGNAGGQQSILVTKAGTRPVLLAFCPGSTEIKKLTVRVPAEILPILNSGKILKGKFIAGPGEQLLVFSEKGILMGQLDKIKLSCDASDPAEIVFKVIWKTENTQFEGIRLLNDLPVLSCDLNRDGLSELLLPTENGNWKILKFNPESKEGWKIVAEGNRNPVKEWDPAIFNIGFFMGRFLPRLNEEVILTVVNNKISGKNDYSLRWFNPSEGRFEPRFTEKQQFFGKTIGLDTLKPSDQFFTGEDGSGQGKKIFRLNRDWRFDLKQLKFNDTTFQIVDNLDFRGYDKDHNPKYYEQLQLIPGKFSNTAMSVLVIGTNTPESKDLPDVIELYTLPQK